MIPWPVCPGSGVCLNGIMVDIELGNQSNYWPVFGQAAALLVDLKVTEGQSMLGHECQEIGSCFSSPEIGNSHQSKEGWGR